MSRFIARRAPKSSRDGDHAHGARHRRINAVPAPFHPGATSGDRAAA